jgi:UPF0716 family protein affecting phage T7 exclusion
MLNVGRINEQKKLRMEEKIASVSTNNQIINHLEMLLPGYITPVMGFLLAPLHRKLVKHRMYQRPLTAGLRE